MENQQPSSKQNQAIAKMGYIYCITSPSGKKYIGQTRRDCNKRFKEHCKLLGSCILLENAISKYGEENMILEVLQEVDDTLLNDQESKYITDFNTIEPHGYNIRSGGSSSIHSEESRNRMRKSKLGDKNPNYGKPRTDTAKHSISLSKSGEKHHFFGKELSNDHKMKLSQSHKKYDKTLPMYVAYVIDRPQYYQSSGYVVIHHPILKTKYFTSKKYSEEEKLAQAIDYLNSV